MSRKKSSTAGWNGGCLNDVMTVQPPSSLQPSSETNLEQASTADLIREALEEAKELLRVEVQIAKNEVEGQIAKAKGAAIGLGIAAGAALVVINMLAVALVLALGGTAVVALLVALGFLVVAAIAGLAGYAVLPTKPLERTRHRLTTEVKQLKERIA